MDTKAVLEEIYQLFGHLSVQYKIDFKRFLISLNLLLSLGAIKDKKILDVGSGIGILVGALSNLGADAVGIDKFIFQDEKQNFYTISDFKKLESIWQKGKIKIIKSDIVNESLPFPDETFDVVVSDATIEHLPDSPKDLFLEVRRVLKKNGLFLVTTPNLANLLRRLRFFLLGRSPNWDIKDFFEDGSNFRGHRREFTLGEVVNMLERSSFMVLQKNVKNVFFGFSRFFQRKNFFAQLCSAFSLLLFTTREMIYVLAKKK